MKYRALISIAVGLLIASFAGAADVVDLDGGLAYVRIPTSSEAVPKLEQATLIDLRFLQFPAEAEATELRRALAQSGPLRLVIYDQDAAPALTDLLRRRAPEVLTLAPPGANPAPDFEFAVDRDANRNVYLALENGASVEDVTNTSPPKRRLDEAALVQARRNGSAPEPAAIPPTANEDAAGTAEAAAAQPPADRLLERAIQIARGVLALQASRR